MSNSDLATVMVERFEGCELTAYKDSQGFWTIGWGHLMDQSVDWSGHTISQAVADALLQQDMARARNIAASFPNYSTMGPVRQAVCISMCFQMGSKPLGWPEFMASLKAQDYDAAAANGLDSEWAKETPGRADLEMSMLKTGQWEIANA